MPKLQARAAVAGQTPRAHRLLLDLAVRLEAIQQLDELLNNVPGLDTEVLRPSVTRIEGALVELDTDDVGNRSEITQRQWLSDDWALRNRHVRFVLDLAELCINSGHVFRQMTSMLEALLFPNIIRIHTFYKSQEDSIISLIIETKEGGFSCPISQAAKDETYSRMRLREVASFSDWEWQIVMERTSSDWKSALAEMLCIVRLTYLPHFISLRSHAASIQCGHWAQRS
jgi:hypothetical protein